MTLPPEHALPVEIERVKSLACLEPSLHLLVLFGSRARGDARAASDWDFAYLAGRGFAPESLLSRLVAAIGTEKVDLVDLERAGALLRFRVARDGHVVHEDAPGTFARFWLDAVHFWCDAGPLINAGYEANLTSLVR